MTPVAVHLSIVNNRAMSKIPNLKDHSERLTDKSLTNDSLTDAFGRKVEYLRLSVTDRCDFRCVYCMAEDMTFLPRNEVLSIEEMTAVARSFAELGTKKIRLTGGEPLVRKGIVELFQNLSAIEPLEELCITTNGSRLAEFAAPLKAAGLNRINISLDTLDEKRFKELTRFGKLQDVLAGIDAACKEGFDRIKINAVLMKNYNLHEACDLARFALEKQCDISFIEEMPLGEIHSHSRDAEFVSSQEIKELLSKEFDLSEWNDTSNSAAGPSRYWQVKGYSGRIGFISPHSNNFCSSCNRVRVTASGRLLLCLGNEHSVDLRAVLREDSSEPRLAKQHPSEAMAESNLQSEKLKKVIRNSMDIKPEKHEFNLSEEPQILRFMNTTGG